LSSGELEQAGFATDVKESTRKAVKYRRGAEIVIVIHGARGWVDPLSDTKGDVFSLAEHLDGITFVEALDQVAELIGSSETMGTGVNAQLRLKALHHLDVPWLPSQIEQREGGIVRQGNQHEEVDIFACATEGSLDASMWQSNERKARFIAAALSGDTSIRRLEDVGEGAANQFAMAKAIASGDKRSMQKAGLEADIARLERLRAAHEDDQCRSSADA
jgi:hypothetical protein